jgi:outer membrane protein OmpA-like peptidoglycan-associated protein
MASMKRDHTGPKSVAPKAAPAPARAPEPVQENATSVAHMPDMGAKDFGRRPPLSPSDVVMMQRTAGNSAAAQMVVQRHKIDAGRQGVGDQGDELPEDEVPVQRLATPGAAKPVMRRHAFERRAPAFGRAGPQRTAVPSLWGSGAVQRRGPSVKQAKEELGKFVGGGAIKINNFIPDFTENFGKFDVVYNPGVKQLTINMRVKFTFPDLPEPKKGGPLEGVHKALNETIKLAYATNFIGQVTKGWSGKFQFKNAREPQSVWGALNPITVKLNVTKDDANPHYVLKGYFSKSDVANVTSNPAVGAKGAGSINLFKGDLDSKTQSFTGSASHGPDEIVRLQRNLPKIRFGRDSSSIASKYIPDLVYVSDYLRRMNRPKFNIVIVGRANKSGREPRNVAVSAARAKAVDAKLTALGVTNHSLKSRGDGSTGATADGSWRKVDFEIGVDPSFSNVQDTTLHEFGHMLGLDDEYVTKRGIQLKHQRNFVQKMLGTEAYGKKNKNKYADEITSVDKLKSAGVMYSGDEVRVGNYVTLWQALFNAAEASANQPSPKFSFKDWKVIG